MKVRKYCQIWQSLKRNKFAVQEDQSIIYHFFATILLDCQIMNYFPFFLLHKGSSINDVFAIGGGGIQDFVTTVLSKNALNGVSKIV